MRHGFLASVEDEDGGHLEAAGEVLVGLEVARKHGLELREVVGTIETALVDDATAEV
jgi:hypothetical protein